jgi:excisionase family DNA binding protein
MTDPSEALTIPETCEESRIGRTKIYEAIHDGHLVARKFGKKTLILRSDLRQFLNALPIATEPDVRRGRFARKDQTSG